MPDNDRIGIVLEAVDRFSATMAEFSRALKTQEAQAASTERAVGSLSSRLGVFKSALQGVLQGIGQAVWWQFEGLLRQLENIFPALIGRGSDWVQQVRALQLETGMTAEETSTLIAVMEHLGMTTEGLQRLTAQFGKNLVTNETLFTRLGIATRDANGQYLDAYTIIGNTRRAFAEAGASLESTAAAQELFSRTGYNMLEFLQLSDAEFQALAESARAAGLVLSQDVLDAAERMQRTWGGLWETINGLAVQAFAAIEPSLEAFVANFSNWVRANLNTILSFVVTVANFVMGLIGGLLGFDWSAQDVGAALVDQAAAARDAAGATTAAGAAASGAASREDQLTRALRDQIDAIDSKIAALRKAKDARDAEREQADLERAIASARQELADLQESALNTYGLSAVERVKAEQKRAADIIRAQQKITDAEQKLAEWREGEAVDGTIDLLEEEKRALAEQLKLHQDNNKAISGSIAGVGDAIKGMTGKTDKLESAIGDFAGTAQWARERGIEFSNWIRNTLAPALASVVAAGAGAVGFFAGLVKPLQDLITTIGNIGTLMFQPMLTALGDLGTAFDQVRQFLATLIQWIRDNIPGASLILGSGTQVGSQGGNVLGGGGGGGTFQTGVEPVGYAEGGDLWPGQRAIVGEAGTPEALSWLPGGGVRITPLGGAQEAVIEFGPIYLDGAVVAGRMQRRFALNRNIAPRRAMPAGVR